MGVRRSLIEEEERRRRKVREQEREREREQLVEAFSAGREASQCRGQAPREGSWSVNSR